MTAIEATPIHPSTEILAVRIAALENEVNRRFAESEHATKLALSAVDRHAQLHAEFHEREHSAQERVDEVRRVSDTAADVERRRALDKAEDAILVRLAASNQWQQRFDALASNLVLKETLDTAIHSLRVDLDKIEAAQPAFLTHATSDARFSVAQADRERLREVVAGCVRLDTFSAKMDSIDARLGEVRDWKLQTESQMKTWAVVVGFIVIAVNLAVKYL